MVHLTRMAAAAARRIRPPMASYTRIHGPSAVPSPLRQVLASPPGEAAANLDGRVLVLVGRASPERRDHSGHDGRRSEPSHRVRALTALPNRCGRTTTISAEAAVGPAPSRSSAVPSRRTASIPSSGSVSGSPSQRMGCSCRRRQARWFPRPAPDLIVRRRVRTPAETGRSSPRRGSGTRVTANRRAATSLTDQPGARWSVSRTAPLTAAAP